MSLCGYFGVRNAGCGVRGTRCGVRDVGCGVRGSLWKNGVGATQRGCPGSCYGKR